MMMMMMTMMTMMTMMMTTTNGQYFVESWQTRKNICSLFLRQVCIEIIRLTLVDVLTVCVCVCVCASRVSVGVCLHTNAELRELVQPDCYDKRINVSSQPSALVACTRAHEHMH